MANDYDFRSQEDQRPNVRDYEFFETVAGPDETEYPEEGDAEAGTMPTVYYCRMLKAVSFPHLVGVRELEFTRTDKYRYLFNLQTDKYIEEGSVIMGFPKAGEWFTIDKVQPGLDYYLDGSTNIYGKRWASSGGWTTAHDYLTGRAQRIVASGDNLWICVVRGTTRPHPIAVRKYSKQGTLVSETELQWNPGGTTFIPTVVGFARRPDGSFVISGTLDLRAGSPSTIHLTEQLMAFDEDGAKLWGFNANQTRIAGDPVGRLDVDADGEVICPITNSLTYPFREVFRLNDGGGIVWRGSDNDVGDTYGLDVSNYHETRFDLEGNIVALQSSATLTQRSVAKYDPDGNLLWLKTRAQTGIVFASGISVTADNAVAICGTSTATNSRLVVFDADGNELLNQFSAGVNFTAIASARDGRMLVTGTAPGSVGVVRLYEADFSNGGFPVGSFTGLHFAAFVGGDVSAFNLPT